MINFSTLQGLTIPEGVVTQIADASGRVLWMLNTGGGPVILEVEKITHDTYAGETTYTGEQFILLDIYPKTNGTVSVTYGGLTKTITDTSGAAEPNAQRVFFGTFNGVSDSVVTPASGELTIEGDYVTFACASYQASSKINKYCSCITDVFEWGSITSIGNYAFYGCTNLALTSLPDGITSIGDGAFYGCTNLALTSLPDGITSIGNLAFYGCTNLALTSLPDGITSIGTSAFYSCTNLALTSLPDGITSIGTSVFYKCENVIVNKMPSGMTTIPESCFSGCKKVNAETFDYSGIVTIEKSAFMDTKIISIIRLPEGVATIGEYAFRGLMDVVSVVSGGDERIYIPSTVTEIGALAFFRSFSGTPRTVAIYCYATVPPTVTPDSNGKYAVFDEYGTKCIITVPNGCGAAYKAAAGWSEYADKIVEAS